MATSPLAWQFTWMPARCTRSTHALQLVLLLGDVAVVAGCCPGYGVLSAIVRSENEPSTRVLGRGAEADPVVAEAGLDAARDHASRGPGRSAS